MPGCWQNGRPIALHNKRLKQHLPNKLPVGKPVSVNISYQHHPSHTHILYAHIGINANNSKKRRPDGRSILLKKQGVHTRSMTKRSVKSISILFWPTDKICCSALAGRLTRMAAGAGPPLCLILSDIIVSQSLCWKLCIYECPSWTVTLAAHSQPLGV
jgi:hypothetical protein